MSNENYLSYMVDKIFELPALKATFALILFVFNFLFDERYKLILLAVLILIIFDFITGVYSSYVSGEEIKSAKVFRSAVKTTMYFLIISSSFLAEKSMQIFPYIDETVIGFLAATELVSIMENVGKCGFVIPKKLLKKIKKYRDEQ